MDELSNLLGRIKKSLDQDSETRVLVAQSIKEIAGFDIRLEDVSIKGRNLRIQTTPAKRNEIKLKEKEILSSIKAKTNLNIESITY